MYLADRQHITKNRFPVFGESIFSNQLIMNGLRAALFTDQTVGYYGVEENQEGMHS